jgi:hypothetical protein
MKFHGVSLTVPLWLENLTNFCQVQQWNSNLKHIPPLHFARESTAGMKSSMPVLLDNSYKAAIVFEKYSISKLQLLKASMVMEMLLI